MSSKSVRILMLTAAVVATAGCGARGGTASAETKNTASEVAKDPVSSAESAAPASIARDAAIMTIDASGALKTLRAGKNGWTCVPDDPNTPGPDPMCMDGNAAQWAMALIRQKPPLNGMPGVIYMLAGGSDASNTDPNAKKPAPGNGWVTTGPHLMIVGSKAMLGGYPGGARPNTSAPYVMWAGSQYAHLMVPVTRS